MIHYHGTPITPRSVLQTLAGKHFCVSFADPRDVAECHRIGQSVMLDNGAFSNWTQGKQIVWSEWAAWCEEWLCFPTTWAVLPDKISGDEQENWLLARHWQTFTEDQGVPVWHLHESLEYLCRLVNQFHRVCFGSSGAYATVGSDPWRRRVTEAFDRIDDDFRKLPWVHMLRGMALSGDDFPFASVDSTDVARNHNRDHNNARQMADRWDALQCPGTWVKHRQMALEA